MSDAKLYLIAGVVVEAVKSPGGGFYYVVIQATGERVRCLAEAFELVAVPYLNLSNVKIGEKHENEGNEGTPQKEVAG